MSNSTTNNINTSIDFIVKVYQVDHLIYGKMIGHCLPLFPCKSETEMVVMTEEIGTVGMTGVM
jgi:hypothetical protein